MNGAQPGWMDGWMDGEDWDESISLAKNETPLENLDYDICDEWLGVPRVKRL
jgi:hypothetical protein